MYGKTETDMLYMMSSAKKVDYETIINNIYSQLKDLHPCIFSSAIGTLFSMYGTDHKDFNIPYEVEKLSTIIKEVSDEFKIGREEGTDNDA